MRRICTSPYHKGSRWLHIHYFHRKGNSFQSWCSTCQRISVRLRHGYKPRRPSQTGYRNVRSEQYRAYQRSRYAKMTLERRERKRRYERDMTNLKRREQGIPPRNFRTRKVDLGPNPFYDAAKVYEHIQRFMIYEPRVEDRKGPEELRLNGIPVNETDQRRIRAWSTGEAKMVHQSTLDRIITTYDLSWWEFEEFAVRIAA